jgi:hypothetical protein
MDLSYAQSISIRESWIEIVGYTVTVVGPCLAYTLYKNTENYRVALPELQSGVPLHTYFS